MCAHGEATSSIDPSTATVSAPRKRGLRCRNPRVPIRRPRALARFGRSDRAPRVPSDLEDDACDEKTHDRVGPGEAERDDGGARDDAQGDEAVDASVVAIRDERGTRELPSRPQAYLRRDLVAEEADDAGGGEDPQVGGLFGVDQAVDRLVERHHRAHEGHRDDHLADELLAAEGAKKEGESWGWSRSWSWSWCVAGRGRGARAPRARLPRRARRGHARARSRRLPRATGRHDKAEPNVLDVVHGLGEQHTHVLVVQLVDRPAAVSLPDDETEVTE